MTSMAASATSVALLPSKLVFRGRFEQSRSKFLTPTSTSSFPCHSISISSPFHRRKPFGIQASVSISDPQVRTGPDDLVASILSKNFSRKCVANRGQQVAATSDTGLGNFQKFFLDDDHSVTGSDRGVLLSEEQHKEVAEVAEELQKYCVNEPVKCPLIFGAWDVVYCSVPTSPGGGYRSAVGRIFFQTKEMIQAVEAPDTIKNKVSFSALGFLDGQVSLTGKLTALDDKWIRVVFESPELKVGGLEFRYGGESEVQLQITYIDDKVRLGKGSRGSLFVFQRRV